MGTVRARENHRGVEVAETTLGRPRRVLADGSPALPETPSEDVWLAWSDPKLPDGVVHVVDGVVSIEED